LHPQDRLGLQFRHPVFVADADLGLQDTEGDFAESGFHQVDGNTHRLQAHFGLGARRRLPDGLDDEV